MRPPRLRGETTESAATSDATSVTRSRHIQPPVPCNRSICSGELETLFRFSVRDDDRVREVATSVRLQHSVDSC